MKNEETDRVRARTAPEILARIDQQIEERIRYFATQSRGVLNLRLDELEREWDIDRWLETNFSALALSGLALGLTANRKWFWLTGSVLGCLLQHAVVGWSPPVPLLRRAGVRTRSEIDREKFALKALRGDFETLAPKAESNQILRSQEILRAVRV